MLLWVCCRLSLTKMSFFLKGKAKGKPTKRKAGDDRKPGEFMKRKAQAKERKRNLQLQKIQVESESEVESDDEGNKKVDETFSSDEETAQEKRLRLTKQYLAQLEEQDKEDEDEGEDADKDIVAEKLKEDVLEQSGRLQRQVARDYIPPTGEDILVLKGHKLSITCLVISPDSKHVYTGSKDCSIIKWSTETGKKVHVISGGRKGTEEKHVGHTGHVMAISISSDNKFLATGCRNKLIHIWDPSDCHLIHTFKGHRDAIAGLAFRKGSHDLFSASHDRSVKIWNLDEMAYVETLFGHQDSITGIDSLTRQRAITAGGRDGSIRIWKVVEESQLVFHGHSGSIDCVRFINEQNFLSGADDGSVALWSLMKKKPSTLIKNAHRQASLTQTKERTLSEQNWITSVAALHNTDLVASGSKDSSIRLWQCGPGCRSLIPLFNIPVVGFVNALEFSDDGSLLVAGVGQEHRLGRWWSMKQAKNSVVIVKLKKSVKKQVADL
ncbi:U3 small nucleolar RNA-interacting protein 2-like isoform X2 [Amphiura filiformis]|uniref:U3 small nucleolar RNA-interacting protein 2-like isoform X2 n=1 Tax=Amphiura filiformis TaxID=82378 RepID=UPI003B20DB80